MSKRLFQLNPGRLIVHDQELGRSENELQFVGRKVYLTFPGGPGEATWAKGLGLSAASHTVL